MPPAALRTGFGAYVRRLDDGRQALCRDELCAPLGADQWRAADGGVALEAVCAALDLEALPRGGVLRLQARRPAGLGVGARPPAFSLPPLAGGAEVSPAHFYGKRAIYYMWASW